MKVLLINPAMPYEIKGHLQTPLGLCYLSSVIKPLAESLVYDCNVRDDIETVAARFQPDIIGVNVLTSTFSNSINIVRRTKALVNNKCIFIAGGVHASAFPEKLLRKGYNLVIRGEGERTFFRVINAIVDSRNYFDEPGVSYIDNNGNVENNSDASLIEDLDTIPFPRRDDLVNNNYEHESILTSRGCYYRCFYCSSSHYWGRNIRYRSAENVFDELKLLYKEGKTKFYFCDDNYTSSHQLVREICERIISEKMDIRWSALTRVDTFDSNLIKLMKDAGCALLALGIENGISSFQSKIKYSSIEAIKNAFQIIRNHDIKTRTTWIVGVGSSFEEEYQSLQLIKEILPDHVSIHCLIPFPNTEAWSSNDKYGIILDKNNFNWDVMNMTYSPYLLDHVRFKHISKEQILYLLEKIRDELICYGYDGTRRKFDTFLDNSIIKVLE